MSDTREYIIDQAYGLFLSKSYEAVSISEISKAIGLTKGALYHHFKNKEELFKAVIDKHLSLEEFFAPIDEITLLQYIEESIKNAEKIVHSIFGKPNFVPLSYVALLIDAYRHYPGLANVKCILSQREHEKLKNVLNNAVKRGEIRKDINIDIMAMNFFSIGVGIAGNLIQDYSPKLAVEVLRNQFYELYKILKV